MFCWVHSGDSERILNVCENQLKAGYVILKSLFACVCI